IFCPMARSPASVYTKIEVPTVGQFVGTAARGLAPRVCFFIIARRFIIRQNASRRASETIRWGFSTPRRVSPRCVTAGRTRLLLRPPRQGTRRTAEQRDEFSPVHVWMAPAWQEKM